MAKRPRSSIPRYKRRRGSRSLIGRVVGWLVKLVLAFLVASVLWVLAYRFVNPPITVTMLGDIFAGRGATREWMPISRIDRDMVRASIAAEDSKFCTHHGFDFEAIEDAMKRNASGGRIRGGSTISQQTAKNAFLWQNGGYARKGLEAWFTFLIEHLWGKRRIMEVYLNLAETGIGTYGVNAGSERYFGHDASAMSPTEAARIAAVLPLPKERAAIAPKGFTRRYGNTIAARIPAVARNALDACVYKGTIAPVNKAPPPIAKKPRPLPGEEYENAKPLPPLENAVNELPPASTEPLQVPGQKPPPATNEAGPPPLQAQEPANGVQPLRRTVREPSFANGTAPLPRPLKPANPAKEEFMATRTQTRNSTRSNSNRSRDNDNRTNSSSQDRSAFSWGESAGPLLGAALAGVAIGFAANYGRKALMQGMEAAAGDWEEILAAEHDMALAIFDKMLATDQTQTFKRKMLLMKLTHALDKHAHQEEMVVYPALREDDLAVDADHLENEHGYIKTFIYELNEMGADSPNWLEKVRKFRDLVSRHVHMEEEEVFPRFKKDMSAEQNARVTSLVNRDGFWMA